MADTGTTSIRPGGDGPEFVKHHPNPPPRLLEFEAVGLRALHQAGARVPEVLRLEATELVTTVVPGSEGGLGSSPGDPEAFGRELAALHQTTRSQTQGYGAIDNEPIGWLGAWRIDLTPTTSWAESYLERRVGTLARQAADQGAVSQEVPRLVERLNTDHLGPTEPPTLVHGDLWAGNRMVDGQGQSWLIDPSAHYGHREEDLAMMQLFGGFTDREIAAYNEAHPLADGWRERIGVYQLVPLLVHALLFGGGYGRRTEQVLRQTVGAFLGSGRSGGDR